MLSVDGADLNMESLQKVIEGHIRDNDDLRVNLQLNKASLQSMMLEAKQTATKEKSLIETINIVSKDNTLLKDQIDSLKYKLKLSK